MSDPAAADQQHDPSPPSPAEPAGPMVMPAEPAGPIVLAVEPVGSAVLAAEPAGPALNQPDLLDSDEPAGLVLDLSGHADRRRRNLLAAGAAAAVLVVILAVAIGWLGSDRRADQGLAGRPASSATGLQPPLMPTALATALPTGQPSAGQLPAEGDPGAHAKASATSGGSAAAGRGGGSGSAAGGGSGAGGTSGNDGTPSYGTPAAADEFGGTDLDASNWGKYDSTASNGSKWSSAMDRVSGGELQIVGTGRNSTGAGNTSGGVCWGCTGTAHRYGVWQLRARFDRGSGYAPVIGLAPANGDMGKLGWITLMNMASPDRTSAESLVHGPNGSSADVTTSADGTAWHTYTIEWRADVVRMYRDGTSILDTTGKGVTPPNVPMYLFIQQEVGPSGSVPAPNAGTPDQVTMHFDWVRYYN